MSDTTHDIPFNRPVLVGRELDYMRQAVESMHTSGDGPFSARVAALLRDVLEVREALLTPSCTDALEMCALLLDLGPGDEIIVPSFAFVSTVNAFVMRGARPVFAEIRPDTLNVDESLLEPLITPRTRAIVVLHYAGVSCEMDAVLELARRRGVEVIEDNAHGLFATYRGAYLGTLAPLATLSFHETKNFACGEGGALLINDPAFIRRAEIVRDKGTDRQQLFRGQVDKYTWIDLGSSFVLSDLLAAFLYAQLEQRDRIMTARRGIWERYDRRLRGSVERSGVRVPTVPPHCGQGFHMYYLLMRSLEQRQALIAHLGRRGIHSVFHYTPLHLSRMGRTFGGEEGQLPVTERVSDTLVRLPFYYDLGADEQDRVVDEIESFLDGEASG